MSKKLLQDISASALQVLLNQALGLFIFLAASRYLSKEIYGEMNWSLAVLTCITSVLSLRLEQIIVSRIAKSKDDSKLFTLFTIHVFLSGCFFYTVLLLSSFLLPGFFKQHHLLLLLAVSHILSFFTLPFKQLVNGKENFRALLVMSAVANLSRAIGLGLVIILDELTIQWLLTIYIISSILELSVCFLISSRILKFSFRYKSKDYFLLIKESLPLAGAVILNVSIARIDWILLGIFSTTVQTAEYSFAYRIFELSPFPLLILSPILLTRFSRLYAGNSIDKRIHDTNLVFLVRIEMLMATLIPLALNLCWVPAIDAITGDKYGASNETSFFILSCCVPFLYMNNIQWSLLMAQNRLSRIFYITLITFLIILTGDLVLIPLHGAKAAALVYLAATVVEYFNYNRSSSIHHRKENQVSLFTCFFIALSTGLMAYFLFDSCLLRLAVALPVYCLLLLATKQLQKNDWVYARQLFRSNH